MRPAMTIVLISDIHDRHVVIPKGDTLVLAGDIFCGDDMTSLRSDLAWIKSLGFKHTVLTLGNHDLVMAHLLKTRPAEAHDLLKSAGIQLLQDNEVQIAGLQFYGVGWNSHAAIPTGVDVIVSHCPPAGILDGGMGCPALRRAILAAKPRLHIFGHVHGYRGHVTLEGIDFYNASLDIRAPRLAMAASNHSVTLPTAQPWVVEI